MSDQNRHIIQRYYGELWNHWRFDLISELIDDDIVFRGSLGTDAEGRDGFRKYMQTVRDAFPDFHNSIEEVISEADTCAVRLTYRGTQEGPLFGVPPTRRMVEYSGAAFFHLRNGRVVSGWVLGDKVSLWRQIVVAPAKSAQFS